MSERDLDMLFARGEVVVPSPDETHDDVRTALIAHAEAARAAHPNKAYVDAHPVRYDLLDAVVDRILALRGDTP